MSQAGPHLSGGSEFIVAFANVGCKCADAIGIMASWMMIRRADPRVLLAFLSALAWAVHDRLHKYVRGVEWHGRAGSIRVRGNIRREAIVDYLLVGAHGVHI